MPDVRHEPAAHRFVAEVGGGVAELEYQRKGGDVAFVHTFVPKESRGQDVGSALAEAGLGWARSEGLGVIPACPFVESYMADHPETEDLRAR